MTERPLLGRRIVVTRAQRESAELAAAISSLGGEPIVLPMLEIVDVHPIEEDGEPAGRLLRGQAPDWLVATSRNGARRSIDLSSFDEQPRIASVGPSTKRIFEDAGWTVDFMPSEANAATLASEFPPPVHAGGRVLVVQGDLARPTAVKGLRELGWQVGVVVAYRNITPSSTKLAIAGTAEAEAVIFASPTAVRRYFKQVGICPRVAICIGPVTAQAALEAGFDVSIAPSTSSPDLISAVADAFPGHA